MGSKRQRNKAVKQRQKHNELQRLKKRQEELKAKTQGTIHTNKSS
jgi:hypothetical protein